VKNMKLSVVIPTHNRVNKLVETLARLRRQNLAADEYEIIVVDDGSSPPANLPENKENPSCSLVRLEGVERSAARNAGAAAARGRLLVFVDDDMTVGSDFLDAHLRAHQDWRDALVVGAVRLPDEAMAGPFGRFRQNLEQRCAPQSRGITSIRNFCTAQNMSIPHGLFEKLGGFDQGIVSSEDQDLALRHTAGGGQIIFLPEAEAIHRDSALDIRSYCRRTEWGSEEMVPFCRRHADWPDNVERERVNGPIRWGREPLSQSSRKLLKLGLTISPVLATLFVVASILERTAPDSFALDRVYRLLLGAHILRGYRKGRKRAAIAHLQAATSDGRLAES
jgi:GT2 family glycosyltransferase